MVDDFKLIPFPGLSAGQSNANSLGQLWVDLDGLARAAAKAAQTAASSDLDPHDRLRMVSKLQDVVRDTCAVCLSLADATKAPDEVKDQLKAILSGLGMA